MIKFGIDQISKPAPLLYRRIINALIIFVIPSTATLVISLPVTDMSETTKIVIGLLSTYVIALLKGFEYLIGDEVKEEPK